ncbi:hypothetical protein K0V43_18710, partial [Leptospira sp. id769339]|nr:hypothetical protein [Leptospira sp. id769339]
MSIVWNNKRMKKKSVVSKKNVRFTFPFFIGFLFLFSSCWGGANILDRIWDRIGGLPPGVSFPSPGSAPAPEGSDLFSISTNHSETIEDPNTKAEPLSGALFISPPEPNNYGAVSLSYPISVPVGRAGVQPNLAISYSSTGSDGWIGVGWNLGLGAISRTPEYGALFYDSRDTFSWNGKKLIKESGSTSNENGVYRPEITDENATLLKLTNIESGGIWEVLDSSGSKTIYGNSASNRIYDPNRINRTYSWYFSRQEDRNGNFMQVEYDTSQYSEKHYLYIKEIRYTGNSRTGISARQYVKFITKPREDSYVSNTPGFLMKMDRILERIEVGWNGEKLWDYDLIYGISPDSGRPILKTVESSRHTTKPEFEYQVSSRKLVWQNLINQAANEPEDLPDDTEYFEGDFNGDGISDLLFFNPKNGNWRAAEGSSEGGYKFKIYANRYKNYVGPEKIRFFKGNVSGDYNGDGRADIAFYLPETREFVVAEHDGRVFQFRNYGRLMSGIPDIFRMEWFPGDYDGNGLSDSVLFDEPTGQWTLMLNKGGSFEFLKFSKKFQNVFRGDYSPNGNLDSESTSDVTKEGLNRGNVQFLIGDYNGDGRTDISLYDSRSGKWIVGENHRNEDKGDPLYFKLQWRLYKIFTAPEQALFGNDRFSGDFNGDGLSDFLLFDRSSGEWTLGETGNGTINFRVWSNVPQFKEITRWLQGDFNGDGKTDIGFFSASDGKFWIGEATKTGFRYRIYSDMSYGPDQSRVMQTPLPKDEVKLTKGFSALSVGSKTKTILLDYVYDGNFTPNRGELAFAGCFTTDDCSANPELLIYDRKSGAFDFKQGANFTKRVYTSLNPEDPSIRLLFGGKTNRYTTSAKDEILFYKKNGNINQFFVLKHSSGNSFTSSNLGSFTDSNIESFSLNDGVYLVDNFDSTATKSVLVLDDQSATGSGKFYISGPAGSRNLNVTGDVLPSYLYELFQYGDPNNRLGRRNFSFFSGDFLGNGKAQILFVDRRFPTQKWYLGTIGSSAISFKLLAGNPVFPISSNDYDPISQAGTPYGLLSETGIESIVIGDRNDGGFTFYRFKITLGTNITRTAYTPDAVGFGGDFDHNGNPVVLINGERKLIDILQNKILPVGGTVVSKNVDRPDLMSKVYVYRWIQGDYNGDGLTDIGIIHLKEPNWYFAMSDGIVPDVINNVKNGIGGWYELQYENSTKFDNTGEDDISDLPGNYRVCTKITVDDGVGNRTFKSYEYSDGYAFSAFIEGKREADYFGFSRFVQKNPYGERTVHKYNNVPYADFRMNRALAGAEKESNIVGSDNQDYGSVKKFHEIKKIEIGPGKASYLVVPTRIENFIKGTKTKTTEQVIVLNGYNISKKTEMFTDHYSDGAHPSVQTTNITDFETINATNQTRVKRSVSLSGSANEITSLFTYDGQGNQIRSVVSYTGSGLAPASPKITDISYDSLGNVLSERDSSSSPARGTEYEYDTELRQFVVEKTSFGGSVRLRTRFEINYTSSFGAPNRVTDPNGNKTIFEYDSFGRITKSSVDTDQGTKVSAIYSYDPNFPLSAKTVFPSGTWDPDFASREYRDGIGRTIYKVKTASQGRVVRTGRAIYDGAGRISRQSQMDWTDSGDLDVFAYHLEEKNPTSFEYDAIGRVKTTTLPIAEGETSPTILTSTYNDPYEVIETHSGGTSKRSIKNARGHVLYVEDSGADGVNAQIGFCYDLAGNRTKKSDLNNGIPLNCNDISTGITRRDTSGQNQAYWSYDGFGRVRVQSDPDLGLERMEYNSFGDLSRTTDANGLVTTLTYDSLGRLIVKNQREGATYLTYDSLSGSQNSLGKLVQVEDRAQIKTFSYDKLGRVKKETRSFKNIPLRNGDVPYITEYEYDLLGRVSKIDYPEHPVNHSRLQACYTYGTAGYITGISVQVNTNGILPGLCNKTIVEGITYNEFGQTAGFRLGNGIQTDYTYDSKQRLVRLHSSGEVGGVTKVLQDAIYSFNSKNNITAITNAASEYNTQYNYEYDGLNRLVNASGTYTETADAYTRQFRQSFSHEKNANLAAKRSHNFSSGAVLDERLYQYENHQVRQIDSSQYGNDLISATYDPSGNMISQTDRVADLTKRMEYDSENRIVRVRDKNGNTVGRYWYDDGGFRVHKSALIPEGAQSRHQEILYPSKFYGIEYMEEENILRSINNIYLNGVRIAALAEDGRAAYFLTDQVDSVSTVLDDSANTVSRMQYEPYGDTFVQRGNQDLNPKYNSQELDKESGFYFYNARYYDPKIARFTSADSIIDGEYDTQGWNRFSYVKGNPITYKDPTGHEVMVLKAETGAGGAGHTAVLVEMTWLEKDDPNYNKWKYFSKNGIT